MVTVPEAVRLTRFLSPLNFFKANPPIKIRNIYFKNCLQCPAYFLSKGLGTNVSAETSFGLSIYQSLLERWTQILVLEAIQRYPLFSGQDPLY